MELFSTLTYNTHMSYNLLFLDTETTGNEEKDRLCQVCYSYKEELIDELFLPPLPVSIESQAVHHITPKMLKSRPPFIESQTYKKLKLILEDESTIFVAHNAKFDIKMLEKEGLSAPVFIDTLRVARALDVNNIIPRYNLQYLRYYLEMDIEATAHDAKGDVLVLQELFTRLFNKLKKEDGFTDEKAIQKMIDISSHPSLMHMFTFGKYQGRRVDEILKVDRGYLEWMLVQKKSSSVEDEDWVYTLEYYLK